MMVVSSTLIHAVSFTELDKPGDVVDNVAQEN